MITDAEEIAKSLQNQPKDSSLLRKLGQYYLFNGFYKQARDEYHLSSLFSPRIIAEILLDHESVLEKSPRDIEARLALTSFCLSQNDIDAAILELEELLDYDKNNLQAYNILGQIYTKQERIDEAMALLEKAFNLGLKDLSISEMLASVYLEKKRYEEAIHFYEELPKDKKNLRTLAELYLLVGKFEKSAEKYYEMYKEDPEVANEALIKLEELLTRNVGSVFIRELLFDVYSKALKPDLAVKKLYEILKIAPEKIDFAIDKLKQLMKSYPMHPEATSALADFLAQKGSYSESIEEYYKITKSDPSLIEKAVEGCKAIIGKYPDQFLARQFLVETYLSQGKISDAIAEINDLLKIYPDSAEWIISKCKDASRKYNDLKESLGYAYLAKGDYSSANLEAENLLSANRQNVSALLLLGEIFIKQKQSKKATEIIHKALEIAPYNPSIHEKYREAKIKELEIEAEQIKKRISEDEWKMSFHLELGKNYLARNEKESALREFQTALKDTQKAALVYTILGNLYRNDGLYDQSIDAFRKGTQSAQDNSDQLKKIKFGMALTYEAQGQVRYAVKLLEEIEQEDVDFPGLKDKIKFLKNTSMISLQNKSLVIALKDSGKSEFLGMWGRESKKAPLRNALSVSFGQNYNNSGLEFFLKGMYSAAEEEFNLSSSLDPNYTAGINNLAIAQLMSKKQYEALNNLNKAYDLEPAYSIILNNLGVALMLNGSMPDAIRKFEKAVNIDPELSQAKINLADAYYKTGKVKEALELYKQILPSDIMYDIAQQRLLYKTA